MKEPYGGLVMTAPVVNLWDSAEHAWDYLRRADSIPHRVAGEATLLEFLPAQTKRILDLGSRGGRLLALVKAAQPDAEFVALDFSPTMLQELRKLFGQNARVTIVEHHLDQPLPPRGCFDAVVSSFAIHHRTESSAILSTWLLRRRTFTASFARHLLRERRPVEQTTRYGDAVGLVTADWLYRRGLPLEALFAGTRPS